MKLIWLRPYGRNENNFPNLKVWEIIFFLFHPTLTILIPAVNTLRLE